MSAETLETNTSIATPKPTKAEREQKRLERRQQSAKMRAEKEAAYAPVKDARAVYHDAFVKAKYDTDPAVVIALQKYRAAFKEYKQFIFQTEGLDAVKRAVGAESWKARPYLSIAGKHITPEQMSATVAVGSIAVPAVAAAPLATAFHLGGTSLYAMIAAGAGFGVASHVAIKPVAKGIREEYSSKELAAREAGQSIEDFEKENSELLRTRAKSIKNRRFVRLLASLGFTTTTVVTTGMLTPDHVGHSAGQWASKGVDTGLHHIGLEQGWADYLAHGTGAFQELMQKVGAFSGAAFHELFGVKSAMAAELHTASSTGSAVAETTTTQVPGAPEVGRTQLITHFGSAPWALTREAAYGSRSISDAADMLIRGGMPPEARSAFIAAATAQGQNHEPAFIEFVKREWEAQAFKTRGVPRVLGDGVDRLLFDATRDPGFIRGATPPTYRAEQFSFSYTDAVGRLHNVVVDVPVGRADGSGEQCYNFSLFSDTVVPSTPPLEAIVSVPPPTPEAPLVAARAIWSEQSGFVAVDCNSCGPELKITNLRILEYRGEGLEEAREYASRVVSEASAWTNYQTNMSEKFIYVDFYNTLTNTHTYECLNLKTGVFSNPTIVDSHGTSIVRTPEQFHGVITGDSETWRMTGERSPRDIFVMHPKDPMPLFPIDMNGDGIPEGFVFGGDYNHNGVLESSEVGRNLTEVINNQIYFIGNDIIPQETGNPNAQPLLERTFLSRIPDAFIEARSDGARFSALKSEFGSMLNDEQIRELGRWLHFYGDSGRTLAQQGGATPFRNPDGSSKAIFQFFQEGITASAEPSDGRAGAFSDLRRTQ